ncbi:Plant protein of unknown function (DUF247) [Quillaja saponaria]|uniref:Uncharacterized protein n=1 Tax=Quillaja saponaria TaxID=32244 RepID=A0AAD7M726_QUISA|nr:Plant protein of unknown function (DUF247) [Quillaja saponaria]
MASNVETTTDKSSEEISNSIPDENSWLIQITEMFTELDHQSQINPHACVFHVPQSLSSSKPEAYVPQLVALGPYHHFRPELYPMERFKLIAANKILKQFQNIQIQQLILELEKLSPDIRSCYNNNLDFKDKTLACIIAIDSLFFLDLLLGYSQDKQVESLSYSSEFSQLFETTNVKLTKDGILRDALMLENQIPTCLLRKIFSVISSKSDFVNQVMDSMLLSFCQEVSPFALISSQVNVNHTHLLDLMYHLIVPDQETQLPFDEENLVTDPSKPEPISRNTNKGFTIRFVPKAVLDPILGFLEKILNLNVSFLQPVKKPLSVVLMVAENLPSDQTPTSETNDPPPVAVMIPSVSLLNSVGIKFSPASGGIAAITFDYKTGTLYLPVVKLDVNSEVIMRNLVAYEAMTKSESLIFTRYTELMGAMVDTVEDVQVLVEKKIVVTSLGVGQVEKLFNGMTKSIGATKTPNLDKTIEKVNKYYNSSQKVKTYRIMKKYVYSSWKFCTFLASIFLLLMTALQSFCSVYDCSRSN